MIGVPTRRGFIFSGHSPNANRAARERLRDSISTPLVSCGLTRPYQHTAWITKDLPVEFSSHRVLLLLNPRARGAPRAGWRKAALPVLEKRGPIEVVTPSSAEETASRAREAARQGFALVIAAGGDGTVNTVAGGLAGSGTALGILPLGTANDLARELGIPRDPGAAAKRIVEGVARTVDVVEVNGRPFVGVGGLALVAQSALAVTRAKESSPTARGIANLLGGSVYRVSATANLLGRWRISDAMRITYRSPNDAQEHVRELRVAALFVTNHRTAGGGLVLPVDANPADGVFELCVVAERARHSLIVNFARLSAGRPLAPGVLDPLRACHAIIETASEDAFVADGEMLARGTRFELRMRPGALRVIC